MSGSVITRARKLVGGTIACAMLALVPAQAHAEPAAALLPGNQILTFDTATPQTVAGPIPVTGLGSTETLRGLDFRPSTGQLFGLAVTTGSANNSLVSVYVIDPATGAATLVGTVPAALLPGAADVAGDYDFNSTVDRIRYVTVNDENARFNPNNGTLAGNDTDITPGATTDIVGLAYDRNTVINPPAPPGTQTTVYVIDRNGSTVGIQGGVNGSPSPNGGVITDIGSLGVTLDAGAEAGFDISPTGAAYAALTAGGVTGLYKINFPNTAATAVGPIGDGTTQVYALSIATDADGDGLLFVADNCPFAANADQADLDSDGIGDACDPDQDNDGLSDAFEKAIGSDPRSTNSDGDGVGDGGDACPALPGTLPNGCPDITLPDTKIKNGPKKKTSKTSAKLTFTSTEAGSTFACSLDGKAFKPCESPQKYKHVKAGKHTFEVRAIDPAGNLDPTPASRAWTVKD